MFCLCMLFLGSGEVHDGHPVQRVWSQDLGYLEGRQTWGGEETDPDPVHCSLQAQSHFRSYPCMAVVLVEFHLSLYKFIIHHVHGALESLNPPAYTPSRHRHIHRPLTEDCWLWVVEAFDSTTRWCVWTLSYTVVPLYSGVSVCQEFVATLERWHLVRGRTKCIHSSSGIDLWPY